MLRVLVLKYAEKMTNGGNMPGSGRLKRRGSRIMISADIYLRMREQWYRIGGKGDLVTDGTGKRKMSKRGFVI